MFSSDDPLLILRREVIVGAGRRRSSERVFEKRLTLIVTIVVGDLTIVLVLCSNSKVSTVSDIPCTFRGMFPMVALKA